MTPTTRDPSHAMSRTIASKPPKPTYSSARLDLSDAGRRQSWEGRSPSWSIHILNDGDVFGGVRRLREILATSREDHSGCSVLASTGVRDGSGFSAKFTARRKIPLRFFDGPRWLIERAKVAPWISATRPRPIPGGCKASFLLSGASRPAGR